MLRWVAGRRAGITTARDVDGAADEHVSGEITPNSYASGAGGNPASGRDCARTILHHVSHVSQALLQLGKLLGKVKAQVTLLGF
jgi:hypothetical protein